MPQRTTPSKSAPVPAAREDASVPVPAFRSGGEFTLGAEEEVLLVRADGRLVTSPRQGLLDDLVSSDLAEGTVSPEIFSCQVEFATAVCSDADEVGRCLARLRQRLRSANVAAMAVGVHPSAPFGSVRQTSAERYDPIVAEFAGLYRTPTAAFQVHVGLPDPVAAITAYRGLRNRLPLLRALAATSPFWHGRDSGLASARSALMRSYPRHGVPPLFRSYDEFVALGTAVARAAEVADYTYLWWDLRLQPRLGTVEVRVMDAQPSLAQAVALTALVQGLARYAVERPTPVDLPGEVLAENDFRAFRYGLDARMTDLDGSVRPVRELAMTAMRHARGALRDEGDEPWARLAAALDGPAESDRQRQVAARHGMAALLQDLTATTMDCSW